jgi:two-component system, NarL family, sensor histidine kinase UhpB
MSLRMQINLLVTALMLVFAGVLIALEIDNTRRAVHEEVMGANVVAHQLLSRMNWLDSSRGLDSVTAYLDRVGRVRANEISLYDPQDQLIYRSPPSAYKVGREAPAWYARLVAAPLPMREVTLPGGRITLTPDATRATLDGWDDLRPLLWLVLAGFVLANALVYALISRATRPLRRVVQGLRQMEQGDYSTRLPALAGREGKLMGHAFNAMAQSVQDSAAARLQALEARQALAENRELTQVIQARIELERGAIARELHDEIGQQVTAIKTVGLVIARRSAGRDADIEQSARLVMTCADEIYDGVHRLVSQLRPPALDRFGLRDALQDLFDEWRERFPEAGLSLAVNGELDGLDDATATAVYRIVQEAVTNALRHAGASRIEARLQASGNALLLDVTDNGSGRIDAFHSPGHFGVLGMRERAHALGGELVLEQIGSGAGTAGVRVHVSIPRVAAEKNHQQPGGPT